MIPPSSKSAGRAGVGHTGGDSAAETALSVPLPPYLVDIMIPRHCWKVKRVGSSSSTPDFPLGLCFSFDTHTADFDFVVVVL